MREYIKILWSITCALFFLAFAAGFYEFFSTPDDFNLINILGIHLVIALIFLIRFGFLAALLWSIYLSLLKRLLLSDIKLHLFSSILTIASIFMLSLLLFNINVISATYRTIALLVLVLVLSNYFYWYFHVKNKT
jgi:hypothetical protein